MHCYTARGRKRLLFSWKQTAYIYASITKLLLKRATMKWCKRLYEEHRRETPDFSSPLKIKICVFFFVTHCSRIHDLVWMKKTFLHSRFLVVNVHSGQLRFQISNDDSKPKTVHLWASTQTDHSPYPKLPEDTRFVTGFPALQHTRTFLAQKSFSPVGLCMSKQLLQRFQKYLWPAGISVRVIKQRKE